MGLLVGIPLAVLGAALLIGGIVGYIKFKDTAAKTISAAAAAAGLAIWVIILFVAPISQETSFNQEPADKVIVAMMDYNTLTGRLTAEGVTVETLDELLQPFFTVTGRTLRADGNDLQVFEYPDEAAMNEEADDVSPDGFSVGTIMISWIDAPHFYKSGRIIVIYIGGEAHTLQVLDGILGPQFAGQ